MEHALIDYRGILLGEDNLPRADLIKPRHRLAGFQRLAGRIASGGGVAALFTAINKQLNTRLAVVATKTIMVSCPFIAKHGHLRQRRMHGKHTLIAEDGFQHGFGGRCFDGAVKFIIQVSHRQMHPPVERIG
jgi:hypothetical protein